MPELPIFGEYATLVAVGSAAIASISMGATLVGARVARKNYRLATLQAAQRSPTLDVSLTDSWTAKSDEGDRWYAIRVLISNTSDLVNSIGRAELYVGMRDSKEASASEITTLSIPCSGELPTDLKGIGETPLVPPISVTERGIVPAAFLFRTPSDLIRSRAIEGIELLLTDVFGTKFSVEGIFPRPVAKGEPDECGTK